MTYDVWLGFDVYCAKLAKAKKRVAQWYNDEFDQGRALVLAGGCGSGKTHLARVVLTLSNHQMVLMISEPDMLANIKATYGGDGNGSEGMVIANYRRAQLLILDDVGTAHVKRDSQTWLEDIYWRIFDRRAELKLPTFLTTNLTLLELEKRLGDRAMSRLLGMLGKEENYIDMFGVEDYRRRNFVQPGELPEEENDAIEL